MALSTLVNKTSVTVAELRTLHATAEDIGVYLASAGFYDIYVSGNGATAYGELHGIRYFF